MDCNKSPRTALGSFNETVPPRTGRQQSAKGSTVSSRQTAPLDRRTERFDAAERSLEESYRRLRALGVDPDAVTTTFAVLRDVIAEIRECTEHARRELRLGDYEWDQANRHRLNPVQYPDTAVGRVIPDVPGVNLCPDPDVARTPAEFMDTLRRYWIWSGKPSYRSMARQGGRQFAASTIFTAMKADRLPSFDMVQVIVVACGGSEEHQRSFRLAWRRLQMEQAASQPTVSPPRARALRAVSDPA